MDRIESVVELRRRNKEKKIVSNERTNLHNEGDLDLWIR